MRAAHLLKGYKISLPHPLPPNVAMSQPGPGVVSTKKSTPPFQLSLDPDVVFKVSLGVWLGARTDSMVIYRSKTWYSHFLALS